MPAFPGGNSAWFGVQSIRDHSGAARGPNPGPYFKAEGPLGSPAAAILIDARVLGFRVHRCAMPRNDLWKGSSGSKVGRIRRLARHHAHMYLPFREKKDGPSARSGEGPVAEQGGKPVHVRRHRRTFALVPHAQQPAVAGAVCLEPRLAVRRLRDLCALRDGRVRAAPAARPVAIFGDPEIRRVRAGDDGVRLGDRRGDRRHPCRLHRPQARDDAGDPRLFADDRALRARVELVVVRDPPVPRRRRDRVGMGDRGVDRLGIVAGPRPRQGRRAVAMRRRTRRHRRVGRVADHRRHGAECVALDVPRRRVAGACLRLDLAQHP